MEDLVKDFLKQKSFAIAGSFRNESKYAYRIFKKLKNKGYAVYPVNPGMKEVEGVTCYKTLSDIENKIDVVSLVTPSEATERIVKECKEKGIKKIWMQPGAESEKAVLFCKENDMDVIYNMCVLIQ